MEPNDSEAKQCGPAETLSERIKKKIKRKRKREGKNGGRERQWKGGLEPELKLRLFFQVPVIRKLG